MLEAVIFDMDGLMIDTEVVNYYAFRDFFKTLGVDLSKYDYAVYVTGKSVENAMNAIKEHFQIEFTIEDAFTFLEKTNKQRCENVPLKPGLIELLEYLKENKIKVAMATSSGLQRVHDLFKDYKVLEYFDEIICGTDVKRGKPAPDIFLKACEKLNVKESHALVLEDSEAGIEAAFNAHIKVICIPDMKKPDDKHLQMLEAMFHSLKDVIDYINRR